MTVQNATTTSTTMGEGDINQKKNNNNNHDDNDTNNGIDDNNKNKNDKNDIVTHVKTPAIFSIPIDIIREILSFLPAYSLLHTVIHVSSYLKGIIQNDSYWQNLWTTRQITCFSHYVQLAKQSEVGGKYIPIALSTLSRDYSILIASVLPSQVPNLSSLERNNSLIRVSDGYDSNGNSVTHISIASSPLLLLSSSENADSLSQLLSHLAGAGVEIKRQKTQKSESGTQRVISLRKKYRNESMRLSKALCFLENSKSLGSSRPIIDDFNTLRLFLFSHDLPPPLSRRDSTPEEHETALYEFINALVQAWKCCHPLYQYTSTTRMGLPIQQMERNSTFMTPAEEERETGETRLGITAVAVTTPTTARARTIVYNNNNDGGEEEKEDDGVFFSVSEYVSMPVSSTLMTSSRLIIMPGTSSVRRLRFSLNDTLIYLFLLEHVTFSDIHQHVWNDERKNAICSRILSPTGHAVELRFFTSSLLSVYPRFFVKMEFTQADLPHTRIQEVFEQQRIHPSGPFSSSSSSSSSSSDSNDEEEDEEDNSSNNSHHGNHDNSTLASLFFGGYGRVEVDISPTVSWDNFVRLRSALGLDPSFPMQLLWNVVVFAAGAGGDILQHQKASFAEYYQTSFTAAFVKGFPTPAVPSA